MGVRTAYGASYHIDFTQRMLKNPYGKYRIGSYSHQWHFSQIKAQFAPGYICCHNAVKDGVV